jgi:hypothetical protein
MLFKKFVNGFINKRPPGAGAAVEGADGRTSDDAAPGGQKSPDRWKARLKLAKITLRWVGGL